MDENNSKLFVFDRNEVFLIFAFVILISAISFVLGVRTGKGLSLKEDGYSSEDISKINLKSVAEEHVETSLDNVDVNKPVEMDTEERLREEMEKLAKEQVVPTEVEQEMVETPAVTDTSVDSEMESPEDVYLKSENYLGKYTIQIYAHQSKEMAQSFADVFILKGHDVIINEVVIPGKGKWYRVSIGAFDTMNEAKDYLNKKQDLFQGKKYLIKKL